MHAYEFVLLLVFICLLAGIINRSMKYRQGDRRGHRGRRGEAKTEQGKEDSAQEWDGRLADMEERIKVLERIVTDSSYDLKRKFEELEK